MTVAHSLQPASDPGQQRRSRMSWPRTLALTAAAIYGPQLLMCLYTLGFVACSHCKAAVWQIAPIAPGLFFYEWGRRIFDLPRFSGVAGVTLAATLSLLVFVGLTTGLRHVGRWRAAILIAVALASALLAVALLSAVRS